MNQSTGVTVNHPVHRLTTLAAGASNADISNISKLIWHCVRNVMHNVRFCLLNNQINSCKQLLITHNNSPDSGQPFDWQLSFSYGVFILATSPTVGGPGRVLTSHHVACTTAFVAIWLAVHLLIFRIWHVVPLSSQLGWTHKCTIASFFFL